MRNYSPLILLVLAGASSLAYAKPVTQSPTSALEWFNQGNHDFRNQNYKDALHAYEQVIRLRSPLAPVARIYAAKIERNNGNIERASAFLLPLREHPLPPGIRKELERETKEVAASLTDAGLKPYRESKYEIAHLFFSKAIELDQGSEAALLAATALSRLNRTPEAIPLLERFIISSNDAKLLDEGRALLNELKKTERANSTLSISVAAGATSNADALPDGTQSESKPIIRASIYGDYKAKLSAGWSLRPAVSLFQEELVNVSDRRLFLSSFSVASVFQSGGWRIKTEPYGQLQLLGNSVSFLKPGGRISTDTDWGAVTLRLSLDLNKPAYSLYSYLNGTSFHRSFGLDWNGKTWTFSTMVIWSSENTGDLLLDTGLLPIRNEAWTPSIRLEKFLSDKMRISWENSYSFRNYATLSQPGDKKRDDRRLFSSLQFSTYFSRSLALDLIGEWIVNRSTLDSSTDISNKNYRQGTALLRLRWEVLP